STRTTSRHCAARPLPPSPTRRSSDLDEPTRGLDYGAKQRLGHALRDLAAGGTTVLLATHDVELAAEVADRVVILADGEVVTDGPDRKSTRLNSSHVKISYAVFCLKKK